MLKNATIGKHSSFLLLLNKKLSASTKNITLTHFEYSETFTKSRFLCAIYEHHQTLC